jgi:hypothetical protein
MWKSWFTRPRDLEWVNAARPWWKEVSANGFLILFFGAASLLTAIVGVASGEISLLLPIRGQHWLGPVLWSARPVVFLFLLLLNCLVTMVCLGFVYTWFRKRRDRASEPRGIPRI